MNAAAGCQFSRGQRAPVLGRSGSGSGAPAVASGHTAAAEPFSQAVTAMDVQAALAQLSPEHRQIIVEMYFHGRQVAEIAQSLGIQPATVKSRAYSAIRHLTLPL